jgi:hypothetical protein
MLSHSAGETMPVETFQERASITLDDAIEKIADIAKVPQENKAKFAAVLTTLVVEQQRDYRRIEKYSEVWPKVSEQWLKLQSRIGLAKNKLLEGAEELESAIAVYDTMYGRKDRYFEAASPSYDKLLRDIWSVVDGRAPLRLKYPPARRRRGRPKGTISTDPLFISFVATLELVVEAAGGRLRYAKADGGSLIEVLAVLRLCSGNDWIPKHSSVRAILVARSLAKGGLRAIEKWFSEQDGSVSPIANLIHDKALRELLKNKN